MYKHRSWDSVINAVRISAVTYITQKFGRANEGSYGFLNQRIGIIVGERDCNQIWGRLRLWILILIGTIQLVLRNPESPMEGCGFTRNLAIILPYLWNDSSTSKCLKKVYLTLAYSELLSTCCKNVICLHSNLYNTSKLCFFCLELSGRPAE